MDRIKGIILASQSPRRREILEMIGIDFTVQTADIDEKAIEDKVLNSLPDKNYYKIADEMTRKLSCEKALKISSENKGFLVIGSDTVVVTEERILGKPESEKDAYDMLIELCGRVHRVYTGVSMVLDGEVIDSFSSNTEVKFYEHNEMIDEVIRKYINTKSPMDKAGGYGIQDMGCILVESIVGDYYTVMGLPAAQLYKHINKILNKK